jgi:serine/threonine-protein kinase
MLFRQERIDDALATWESGLALAEEAASLPDRQLAIVSHNNSGSMYAIKSLWADAEDHLRRAHAAAAVMHGPHHPVVATAAANLANVLREAGKFDEALAMQREAHADWERALGAEHPHVAAAQANLGMIARTAGKLDEALQHLETSAAVKRRTLGPDHPDLAMTLNNYGDVLRQAGRAEEALAAHIEALEIWRAGATSDDRLAYALVNIGYDLIDLGRPDEAIGPLEEGLDITQRWQLTISGRAEAAFGLAMALDECDPDRAVQLARDALVIFDRVGGRYLEQRDEVEVWLAERQQPQGPREFERLHSSAR